MNSNRNIKKITMCFSVLFLVLLICSVVSSQDQEGYASWYGENLNGRLTASGERFDMNDYTAAHKEYEFGTRVRVTNLKNNKSVIVRINDRGPYVGNRIIDLSKAAFLKIAKLDDGDVKVKLEVLGKTEDGVPRVELNDDADLDDSDSPIMDTSQTKVYRIQFGAFLIRNNAINLAKDLLKNNIKVKVYRMNYNNGEFMYKVVTEKVYSNVKKAKWDLETYKKMGYDCFITSFKS